MLPNSSSRRCSPAAQDTTPYRKAVGFRRHDPFNGRDVLTGRTRGSDPADRRGVQDISHSAARTPRPAPLDPRRCRGVDNDKYVALELLKNANIAAGGVPPMPDTGTAIVMGKKGQAVWTGGGDEAAIAAGVSKPLHTETSLRCSPVSPLSMFRKCNRHQPAGADRHLRH